MGKNRQSSKVVSGVSAHLVRLLREGALWVFGAVAAILWVALFTYNPVDPGFTQANSATEISNGVGRVGALVADLLFNLFGRPAYLVTVMVFYFGWMIFNEQKTQRHLTRADFALRIGGFLATLVTSCALATLHFSGTGFPATAGGIILSCARGPAIRRRLRANSSRRSDAPPWPIRPWRPGDRHHGRLCPPAPAARADARCGRGG